MGKSIDSYKKALAIVELDLQNKLMNGVTSANEIAVLRKAVELMKYTLEKSPDSALVYEKMGPDKLGFSGADRWKLDSCNRASDELFPFLASELAADLYSKKIQELRDFGIQRVKSMDTSWHSTTDEHRGRAYLYRKDPRIIPILQIINDEFIVWYKEHPVDTEFYKRQFYLKWSPQALMGLFSEERPDMAVLLRLVQNLPLESEQLDVPIDRPAIVEVVEFIIGLIPIVGNIVAAYEAYSGEDLFGYHLTDLERGILAASVLLPIAGRLIKGGKVLYSESRLVTLYGRDAVAWSKTVRGASLPKSTAFLVFEKGEAAIRAQQKLDKELAEKAASELSTLLKQAGISVVNTVDQEVLDLLAKLGTKNKIISSLDQFALERILLKGPNVDHLKGQLLEELIESRIVPWLRERAGAYALGVKVPKKLEFIPGYSIRSLSGRQITDGILVYRNNGVLEIVAIFEAKAGKNAARELSMKKASISALSEADRTELRAYAKDVWRDERYEARKAGKAFTKTIEDIEDEIILSERGGQVRRDIERLSEDADGNLAQIRIGSEGSPVSVRISPTQTKFFGILPKDVKTSIIEKELRETKYSFEMIGADISQKELKSFAEEMVSLATSFANAP